MGRMTMEDILKAAHDYASEDETVAVVETPAEDNDTPAVPDTVPDTDSDTLDLSEIPDSVRNALGRTLNTESADTPEPAADTPEPEIADVDADFAPALKMPDLDNVFTLQSAGRIVSLSIGKWGVNKKDRAASKDVAARANAKQGLARVHKTLMETPTLKQITQHEQATRQNIHNRFTSAFDHTGAVFLPNVDRMEYKRLMKEAETEFWRLVDKFCSEYESERARVAADLGSLYNPADYPSLSEVRSRFKWKLLESAVPGDNFFDETNKVHAEEDARAYRDHCQNQMNEVFGERWNKLYKHTRKLIAKISYDNPDERKNLPAGAKKLFDTDVTKAQDQIARLRSFNVTGDASLNRLCDELAEALENVDADALRENDSKRRAVREKLNSILDRL